MIRKKGQFVRIDTPHTTLVLDPERGEAVYYGEKLGAACEFAAFAGAGRRIFTVFGRAGGTEHSVALYNADGGTTADFRLSRSRILAEKPALPDLPSSYGEGKTLELRYTDAPTKVALLLYFTAFEDSDVIAVSAQLCNGSKKPVRLRRLMSLQIDLPGAGYRVHTFEGGWARERHEEVRRLDSGVFVNQWTTGYSSHARNPFVVAEGDRGLFGFNLVYSGNHKEVFECDGILSTRVLIGMNDFLFDWELLPGESFAAPEAVMCYAPDEDALRSRMQAFVSEHIVRGKWKKRERPVLINNWEGTYFDFTEEKLLDLCAAAKEAGMELFVLDDGWFGKRDSDTCSLGDWQDNPKKTGGGLDSLAAKIREQGLAFGIWMEPEMISEDSDLYRAHPNYAMKIPGRVPERQRNQLMLNLADERVQNFIVRSVSDVLTRSGAAYLKWDFNRSMSDCFGKGVAAGEYFHRYMLGYYRVVAKLVKKFPNVLFEGCAGGGGRFDLGILCYFPQIWTSDDTDARMRVDIQRGTSYAYPQSTMGAHVSACPNHQTFDDNPLSARFHVACGGVLGYELDLTKLSAEERAQIIEQVSFYKENRKLLQFGEQHRISGSPAVEGFITVAKDASAAIAVVNILQVVPSQPDLFVRFAGLNPSAVYEVTQVGTDERFTAGGDLLMKGCLPLRSLWLEKRDKSCSGGIISRVYLIKKCKAR